MNSIRIFTDVDQCINSVTDVSNENNFMIISDALYRKILHLIHDISQIHTIFVLCKKKTEYNQSTKNWFKVKDFFTEILPICEELKKIVQQYEQNAIPISFIATDQDISRKNFDQLNSKTNILMRLLIIVVMC